MNGDHLLEGDFRLLLVMGRHSAVTTTTRPLLHPRVVRCRPEAECRLDSIREIAGDIPRRLDMMGTGPLPGVVRAFHLPLDIEANLGEAEVEAEVLQTVVQTFVLTVTRPGTGAGTSTRRSPATSSLKNKAVAVAKPATSFTLNRKTGMTGRGKDGTAARTGETAVRSGGRPHAKGKGAEAVIESHESV